MPGPYPLIDELRQASGAIPRRLVDRIVRQGAACKPLLLGVLRDWLERKLSGDFPAEASLGLLGEIGDPAVLPHLLRFCALDHPRISGSANWAVARIASRCPAEALESFSTAVPRAAPAERFCLAGHLALLPDRERAGEIVLSLLEGLEAVRKRERGQVVLAVAQAIVRLQGGRGRETAEFLVGRHSALMTAKARRACRDALQAGGGEQLSVFADLLALSVYDLCCAPGEAGDGQE